MFSFIVFFFIIGIMDVVLISVVGWVQVGVIVVYVFVYFLIIGVMVFVILGEVLSIVFCVKMMFLVIVIQVLCGFVMNFVIFYMVNLDEVNLKGKVGFIFGGLVLIVIFGSWVYVFEFKGKMFDEIDCFFVVKVFL